MSQHFEMLAKLFHDFFVAEKAAQLHPLREAQHLGHTPPALALRAVASHAEEILRDLPALAQARNIPGAQGTFVVDLLALLRETLFERSLESEGAYRGALLDIHRGIDLVELLAMTAKVNGDDALVEWTGRWLSRRRALAEQAVEALAWFSEHPARALAPAKPTFPELLKRIGVHLRPPAAKPPTTPSA